MPQSSTLYAVARLKMLRRHFLTANQMQRLLSAPDYGQAFKVLLEAGYVQDSQADWDKAAAGRTQAAGEIVRKLTPDAALSDAFMLRFDAHNLKIFFKARILGISPDGISSSGTIDPEVLRHAVADNRYQSLPAPLAQAMKALEKQTAAQADPMAIDVRLDQAMFLMMHQSLAASRSPAARAWLEMKADFVNLLSCLRLRRMTASLSYEEVLVKGGRIGTAKLITHQGKPELLVSLYHIPYGKKVSDLARAALDDSAQIPLLERMLEQLLRKPFADSRLRIDSPDAVVSYLMDVEQETAAVRLIMTGKRNGLSREAIEERLRAGYGG